MKWLISFIKSMLSQQDTNWHESLTRFDEYLRPMMTRKVNGVRVYREMTDEECEEFFFRHAW